MFLTSYLLLLISLVESIHGGSGHEGMVPLDQQYQLFASAGAIKFPAPESEAWKEKVYRVELLILVKLIYNLYLIDIFIFPFRSSGCICC